MDLYNYLVSKEKTLYPYPPETWWDKACVWVLRNVYGARYWRESGIDTSRELITRHKAEVARLEKRVLHLMYTYIKAVELKDGETFARSPGTDPYEKFYGDGDAEEGTTCLTDYLTMSDERFLQEAQAPHKSKQPKAFNSEAKEVQ